MRDPTNIFNAFILDLFNLYNDIILENLLGFIMSRHNRFKRKNERTKESRKEKLTINCKKTEWMVINKRDNSRYDLCIGDVKSKQLQKLNSLNSVVTDDAKT